MDYIVAKLRQERAIAKTLDEKRRYADYCRIEAEYALAFLLGYLWNKSLPNLDALDDDACESIFDNIARPSIGTIVDICRRLDLEGDIFGKKSQNWAQEYAKIRNASFGHGFLFDDKLDDVVNNLEALLEGLFADGAVLQRELDIVLVSKIVDTTAKGIRYSIDQRKHPWQCSTEVAPFRPGNTYVMFGANHYHRLSPFIVLTEDQIYVYKSVSDIMTGRTQYNQLFQTGVMIRNWEDFSHDRSNDGVRRKSRNGTILNVYKRNYKNYIDMHFKRRIWTFLVEDRASVCATIWGHGGIGKTATVQSVCDDLSVGKKWFDYIVFASAKDRAFSYLSGNIAQIEEPIDSYSGLVRCINATMGAQQTEAIEEIVRFEGRILIMIDDYETFREDDQHKIQDFIKKLDTNRHKVLITTRAAAIKTGERIDTQELGATETTSFLEKILESEEFSTYSLPEGVELRSDKNQQQIHEITEGRPLFIFQFAHTVVQSGIEDALSTVFKNREEAIDFLYGRIYSYLSREARIVFCAISQLVTENDMTNLLSKLRYVVNMESKERNFDSCIQELAALRVLEIVNEDLFTVYSVEILNIMRERFATISNLTVSDIVSRVSHVKPDKSLDVEEALLRRADNARQAHTPEDVEAMYRQILNRKDKSPVHTRCRALRNLAVYWVSERDNVERAIQVLEEFHSEFEHYPEVAKLLADLHWRNGRVNRSIEVLAEHFGPGIWEREGRENSLELLGLSLIYQSKAIIERSEDLEADQRAGRLSEKQFAGRRRDIEQNFNRLFKKFGRPLFERVRRRGLGGLRPGDRHNVITGLYHFSSACLRYDQSQVAGQVCEFALKAGGTGTLQREFERRQALVRGDRTRGKEYRSRYSRPPKSPAMSDAFGQAFRQSSAKRNGDSRI